MAIRERREARAITTALHSLQNSPALLKKSPSLPGQIPAPLQPSSNSSPAPLQYSSSLSDLRPGQAGHASHASHASHAKTQEVLLSPQIVASLGLSRSRSSTDLGYCSQTSSRFVPRCSHWTAKMQEYRSATLGSRDKYLLIYATTATKLSLKCKHCQGSQCQTLCVKCLSPVVTYSIISKNSSQNYEKFI